MCKGTWGRPAGWDKEEEGHHRWPMMKFKGQVGPSPVDERKEILYQVLWEAIKDFKNDEFA